MPSVTVTVTGYKEVLEILKHLPDAVSHRVVASANTKAAKPLVAREKLLAPEGPTGLLIDSIGSKRTPLKKANAVGEITVGPRRKGGYKGYAGHLVEFGTKRRKTKKSGANRGVMPKHPFAKPAFDQTKGQIQSTIVDELSKSVNREIKKRLKA